MSSCGGNCTCDQIIQKEIATVISSGAGCVMQSIVTAFKAILQNTNVILVEEDVEQEES